MYDETEPPLRWSALVDDADDENNDSGAVEGEAKREG
jgi:hypothetical protein